MANNKSTKEKLNILKEILLKAWNKQKLYEYQNPYFYGYSTPNGNSLDIGIDKYTIENISVKDWKFIDKYFLMTKNENSGRTIFVLK